jgi:hypothetical protein
MRGHLVLTLLTIEVLLWLLAACAADTPVFMIVGPTDPTSKVGTDSSPSAAPSRGILPYVEPPLVDPRTEAEKSPKPASPPAPTENSRPAASRSTSKLVAVAKNREKELLRREISVRQDGDAVISEEKQATQDNHDDNIQRTCYFRVNDGGELVVQRDFCRTNRIDPTYRMPSRSAFRSWNREKRLPAKKPPTKGERQGPAAPDQLR